MNTQKLKIDDLRKLFNTILKPTGLVDNFGPIKLTDAVQYRLDKPIGITYFDKDGSLQKREVDLDVFDQMYNISGNYTPKEVNKRGPKPKKKKILEDAPAPTEDLSKAKEAIKEAGLIPLERSENMDEVEPIVEKKQVPAGGLPQPKLNYGDMIKPEMYYKVGNAFLLGSDLTQSQIERLYETDQLKPYDLSPKSFIELNECFVKDKLSTSFKAIGQGFKTTEETFLFSPNVEDKWALNVLKELHDKTISIRRAEVFFNIYSEYKKRN